MLREVDLNKNLTKKEYKEMMDKLAPKFAALQREARAKGLPVMVVFEGWGASGKGTMISRLIQPLDPRGFKVFTIQAENEEEHMHPFCGVSGRRHRRRGACIFLTEAGIGA